VVPAPCVATVPVPPPAYQRAVARRGPDLHISALTLVTTFHLLALCQCAAVLAQRRCPPTLPKGPGGAPIVYQEASLLLIALLRTLWRLSYQDMHDWLVAWPALAAVCGLPRDAAGRLRVPCASQQWKRLARAGAPPCELLFVVAVREAICRRVISARDLIIDSAPIKAWRKNDPDAAVGHAPAQHPTRFLRGFRVHTLLYRGSGLPVLFLLWPANAHDAPFAQRLLTLAVHLYAFRPRVVRLDAAYWGLALIRWIHTVLGATARPLRVSAPGTPSAPKTAAASRRLGRCRNSASVPASNASSAASSCSFTCSAHPLPAGPLSRHAWRSPTPPRSLSPSPPPTPAAQTSSAPPNVSSPIPGRASHELGNALSNDCQRPPPRAAPPAALAAGLTRRAVPPPDAPSRSRPRTRSRPAKPQVW